jgi:hypothetical protein
MVYSNTTNKDGILQKCEFYVFGSNYGSITGNTTRFAEFNGLINDAMDSVVSDILDSDTRWQWDDTNRTDFPIGSIDLVDGQRDYTLDVEHLKIERVECKDASGQYYPLKPIDVEDMRKKGITPTEFYKTNGVPQFYDKLANSIMLYPQPDVAGGAVTASNGLKVGFQRGAEQFTVSDTTKTPGFASIYHKLIPLMASYEYATANDMTNKAQLLNNKIQEERDKLKRFMQKREKDDVQRITMKVTRSK